MVNNVEEKRLSKKHGNVKVFHFSGARIKNINQYIMPIIKKQPDYLIPHVETSDARRFARTKIKYFKTTSKLQNSDDEIDRSK